MNRLASMVLLLWSGFAIADDKPARDYLQKRETRAAELKQEIIDVSKKLDDAEAKLKFYQSGIIRSNDKPITEYPNKRKSAVFNSRGEKEKYIADATKWRDAILRARLNKATQPVRVWLEKPIKVGQVGIVPGLRIHVDQVVDGSAALVSNQHVSDNRMFLRGIDTKGMADDADYEYEVLLEVVGTESYVTALGGMNTVYVLKPFDEKRLDAVRK